MSLAQNCASRLACPNYRQWVLRSFITSIGSPAVPQSMPLYHARRHLSASTRPLNQPSQYHDHDTPNHDSDSLESSTHTSSPQTSSFVPWYLQQQPVPSSSSPFPSPHSQPLPPIPSHAPSILSPLLSELSITLGFDSISLLDLRMLAPPSALGANLFMLLGTARSEKHLHVSADRLCRWLRTTYKLSPHADGLLGRNELKLKIRRKAKRSRLLSSVGVSATSSDERDLDEGLRTGWICVNVGRVEGGELPETMKDLVAQKGDDEVVGFGGDIKGSSLVVQLMTEEKRSELGLESLWEGIMERQEREKEKERRAKEGELRGDRDGERDRLLEVDGASIPHEQQRELRL